jgi:AraC-like DNA-binding protein/mannose-6-phosphate isomerase-like protein (cupin superfamily)
MGHIFSIPPGIAHPRTIASPLVSFLGYSQSCRRADALQSAKRPVAAMAAEYTSGGISTRHRHRRAQFLHSLTGVMTVITETGSFAVTPQQALWIPACAIHQSRCWGDVTLRTLYVERDASTNLPQDFRLIEVPPLLRALVNEAVTFPVEYDVVGREGQIIALILAEIGRMPALPLRVPMPRDRRLARICEAILREPANNQELEHWTKVGGLGRRTLTRLFRKETGMSFGEWRQQVRLMEALTRLTMREPVTAVALDLGYDSPSAFTAMFRRAMGISPREYLRFSDTSGVELHP